MSSKNSVQKQQLHLQEGELYFSRIRDKAVNETYRFIDSRTARRLLIFPDGFDMDSLDEFLSRVEKAESPDAVLRDKGVSPRRFDEVVIHLKDSDETLVYPFRHIHVGYADRRFTPYNRNLRFCVGFRHPDEPVDVIARRYRKK